MDIREELEQGTQEQAALFSALADPTRLKLVKLLCRQRFPNALCVNAMASLLGVSQPAISQHLRLLKATGLLKSERRGYHIHYYIAPGELQRCRDIVSAALHMDEGVQEGSREGCCAQGSPEPKEKPRCDR